MANLRGRGGVGPAWWGVLERLGLRHERWERLPEPARRSVTLGAVAVLALAVLTPLYSIDLQAIAVFLVLAFLFVPPWRRVPVVGRFVLPGMVFALLVSYPYWASPPEKLFTIPILGPFPNMNTMVIAAIFVMMALGLNMVVGYAGLLDLGYVAFYAIGAYTAAWFASPQFAGANPDFTPKREFTLGAVDVIPGIGGFHVSIWLLLPLAAALTAIVGVVIGLPTLRLRGDYLAIVTLGFGEILPQIARNGDNLLGTGFNLTGGPPGITPIDPPGFGYWLQDKVGLPASYITHPAFESLFYWTAIFLVLFTLFCSVRLRDSRLGRAWVAIREDETAAAAMGVPLMRTKTWAYAAGAFFGGIAGCWFATFKTGVFPDDFYFNISVFILCMVIFGGMGNVWGVIAGAVFLAYLDREGLSNIGGWINTNFDTNIDVPLYSFGIYGLIIVVVMLFRPHGLLPEARRKREFEHTLHEEELTGAES